MLTIASPNCYTGRRAPIRLVVLHDMETGTAGDVAQAVGHAFADPARQASAHVGVDTTEAVRYVADADTAWAAPGANADGLQLEMAGRTVDPFDPAVLENGAQVVAAWCRAYGIPAVRLTDAQLAAGAHGIVDHWAVSRVYKQSDHTDTGPGFPWASFLGRVQQLLGPAPVPAPATVPARQPSQPVRLTIDGNLGPRTIAREQQWLGVAVDSVEGPHTIAALQRRVGATPDGVKGAQTIRALQHFLGLPGVEVDGVEGPVTVRALQLYLNAH